jgi:ElaB/YqjD/DUF883 family membrane-anchored ribosome-binding protein
MDMERNANENIGNPDYGTASVGAGNTNYETGAGQTSSTETSDGLTASAQASASTMEEKLVDVGSSVRQKAGSLKNTIADALESGAGRLRQQAAGRLQTPGVAATGGSADAVVEDTRLAQTSNQIAGGMQGAADWLREADLDGVKSGIERQVKEHPARSLAIAVGVGYLFGKAFRK